MVFTTSGRDWPSARSTGIYSVCTIAMIFAGKQVNIMILIIHNLFSSNNVKSANALPFQAKIMSLSYCVFLWCFYKVRKCKTLHKSYHIGYKFSVVFNSASYWFGACRKKKKERSLIKLFNESSIYCVLVVK